MNYRDYNFKAGKVYEYKGGSNVLDGDGVVRNISNLFNTSNASDCHTRFELTQCPKSSKLFIF